MALRILKKARGLSDRSPSEDVNPFFFFGRHVGTTDKLACRRSTNDK
jgi:hypothetical protein